MSNEIIPKELKERINIIKSEVVVWQSELIPYQHFSVYKDLPDNLDYDLILNDGPSPFKIDSHYIDLPNGTISKLLLENKIKPGTFIAWDGRITAFKLLERYFSDNFYLVKPANNSDFNVIQKKDSPVVFRDNTLELMEKINYFKQ